MSTLPAWAHWNLQLERENMEESAMNKFSPDNISAIIHQKFPIWWTEERRGEIRARREKFTFLPYHSCPIFSPCSAKKEEEGREPRFSPRFTSINFALTLSSFIHASRQAGADVRPEMSYASPSTVLRHLLAGKLVLMTTVQSRWSVCCTENREKLSNSQVCCLDQLCLAAT